MQVFVLKYKTNKNGTKNVSGFACIIQAIEVHNIYGPRLNLVML